jgi:hypothetical protein
MLLRFSLLFVLTVTACLGQFESGTILGAIHDPSGATVANATVTLQNTTTSGTIETKSNNNGDYEFINVRLGSYLIRVKAAGFQTSTTDPFDLLVDARQRVDLTLKVGETSQNITVTDAVSLLETDNSSRGQVINPKQIVDLPLNGRAYADLTLLVPGVAKSPLENQSDSSRDGSFNVNGQRSELNSFLLDGIDNNAYGTSNQGFSNQVIQPNPDALIEFKVETDNYSAEFGRATGAVINATIKSGTNQLHGEAWEFLRNTDLNAVGFFKPVNGVKPAFVQNQFGGAAGGPIIKNKIFLFADYEGFRRVFHPVQFATLPTAAAKQGNLGIAVKNPLTGVLYANGVVPATAITPFAQTVFSQLPDPNLPGISNNYVSAPSDTIQSDKGDIRYDETISQKFTVFARYSQDDTRIFSPPAIPGLAGGNANGNVYARNKQLVPGATWTISPTSVLEVRVGGDYTEGGKTPIGLGVSNAEYNIPNLPTNTAFAGGLYSLNFSGGLSQLGRQSSNPQYQYPLVIDPKVNYSRILGRHSLKVGFEYQRIDTTVQDFHPKYGVDNYSGFFSDPGSTSGLSAAQQQAYSLADFIFGARSHYEINNYAVAHLRQRMYFAYLQDDFKVNNKLTLNLGVRYEFATPQWENNNKLANFNPATDSLIFPTGGSLYNRALVHPDPHNWAPRAGIAVQASPKTVIRSAYGISYVQFNRLGGENLLAYNGPNIVDAIIDQVPGQGTGTCTSVNDSAGSCFRPTYLGFPPNFATPAAFNTATTQVRYIPANNPTGYVQSWHFTLGQELGHNFVLDLAYVGNHDTGLMILADANQAVPNALGQNLSVNARRPFANFTTIEEAFAGGFGSYNGLQTKLEKRYSSGLYFINSFTWSKAIDNAPGHLENYDGDNSRINIRNSASEKGPASYNQPFNDTLSVVYDLPFGRGRHFNMQSRALDLVAGGWAVNVINTATSGLPINIVYSPTTQGSVSPLVTPRPNLTGVSLYLNGSNPTQYLNPAAFSTPSYISPFGNEGRNVAHGPSLENLDLGVHKNFAVWRESTRLEFRAEAFNILNKTNFNVNSGFGTTSNSGGFGVFTTALPPRQIQMALKLIF